MATVATAPLAPPPPPCPPVPFSRFYEAPDWRFVVADLNCATLTFLDGRAFNRAVAYVLDDTWVATMDVPSDDPEINIVAADGDPYVSMGNRLLFGFRREGLCPNPPYRIRYSGILMQPNDEITPTVDAPITHVTAYDPWQYCKSRPCLAATGLLPGSAGLSYSDEPQNIVKALLVNAVLGGPAGGPVGPSQCFLDFGQTPYYNGNLNTVSIPSIDINFPQGTMLGDAFTQIVQTGACDIILDPIYDPINRPGLIAEVNVYELAGASKPAAIFSWDKPGRSLNGLNRLQDGSQLMNVAQFYAGQGGAPVPRPSSPSANASINKYGPYWNQQFFPGLNSSPEIVELLAAARIALQNKGKETVTMDPSPEAGPILFTDYFLGDQVPIYASSNFRKPMHPRLTSSGWEDFHRVYAIPVMIPDDSPEAVSQLLLASPFT